MMENIEVSLVHEPNLYQIILIIDKWPQIAWKLVKIPLSKKEQKIPIWGSEWHSFPDTNEKIITWMGGAFAPQLGFWLAVADWCEVLATLDGGVPSCRISAWWLLNIFHFHFFMMDPKIRGSEVLLAAFPFAHTVGGPFSMEQS
jgi:hypothetical protein